jgi:hypothetical protein
MKPIILFLNVKYVIKIMAMHAFETETVLFVSKIHFIQLIRDIIMIYIIIL